LSLFFSSFYHFSPCDILRVSGAAQVLTDQVIT
jgi:hypothetical protein